MAQQTINGTVYRVGQVLNNYTQAALLLDYLIENCATFDFYTYTGSKCSFDVEHLYYDEFPITITALPNPDPVEYKVGDILDTCPSIKGLEVECLFVSPPKYKVTKVPNPDPVAEDWREVVVQHPGPYYIGNGAGYTVESERHALQLAMQEVCKAERVWHMWPDPTEWGGSEPLPTDDGMVVRDFGLIAKTVDITIRCFLLGGRVFVKGGV